MEKNAKIYVAGSKTLVGVALLSQLSHDGYSSVVNDSMMEIDLTDVTQVVDLFSRHKPEYVFLVAGMTGGIEANQKYPARLMLDNLQVICNVVSASHRQGVKKLVYLASSCCYPRQCQQPMGPELLMSGALEPTNEAYASAKLAGIHLCQAYRKEHGCNFIVAIPANPFGPHDDFSLEQSHVIPALILKMHQAKMRRRPMVEIWGTGQAKRHFVFSEDLAKALIFLMERYDDATPINVGDGEGITIRELALLVQRVVGYEGNLVFDSKKPDGMPEKTLDCSPLKQLGWSSKTTLESAIMATYQWFLDHLSPIEEEVVTAS